MTASSSRGRKCYVTLAILLLVIVVLAGGVVFLLSNWRSSGPWRLDDAWGGQNLNHPGPVGTKMLSGAVAYLDTAPKYDGSKVYPGGVPNDGTGVCTDVVWYAAKAAGMDLRELVDADRRADPQAYAAMAPEGEAPNPDIDYRRVRNLIVYFDRHAQSLSTDTTDVASWQPGDIVVWKEHVAIISDRRNAQGLPYVLHHEGNGFWSRYEADVLGNRGKVWRHYRLESLGAKIAGH
ncbi:DUF1287 domain-containing protein [Mobiluncus curtisii]|uniref:Uncharacterized protein conserved in bacteria n=1 Tax=Mobiluncus curtisii TaxID=2051 RepID=A0A2X3AN16_9ACTO|nr:DUF1287 domain-containing protein [Mobiluncus curtisii]QQU08117.1 DUF1287 domain-containing protein [Mobiluncus curtisii]SQB64319.1 Uncharacterized protein conserved in bacteria [Mobiluncus curtisii]